MNYTATGITGPIVVMRKRGAKYRVDMVYDYPEKQRYENSSGELFVHYQKKWRQVMVDEKGQEYINY